jgi:hypothetical protein
MQIITAELYGKEQEQQINMQTGVLISGFIF